MTRITPSLFLAVLLALCLHVASAQAQLVRTCVSMAKGSDANSAGNCHCTTPCRTFATAHANTFSDGEITVLDPGDYGGLTITKSISIVNDSTGEASITVSGGTTGITINAPAGGYVNLRGITIQGVEFGGGIGLQFNTGFALTMTNCVVRNHTGNGIAFLPGANSNLSVSNTLVADNGSNGILVQPSGSGSVTAVLSRVELHNNSFAGLNVIGNSISIPGTVNVSVTDSVAGNNGAGGGFLVQSSSAASNLMVVNSLAANNIIGIQAFGSNARLFLATSTLSTNATNWVSASGGTVLSFGDNNVINLPSQANGPIPTVPKQ